MYSFIISVVRSDFCKPFLGVWNWTSSWYLNSECYCLSWPAPMSQAEISDPCWNSTASWLDSEQILILQILFLCSFSFHNLFSSPTAAESCYSGLYMAKERNGRWDCSIFNASREQKNARVCRARVVQQRSVQPNPQKRGKPVPQEGESHRQNSSAGHASGAGKLTIPLWIYEALDLIFCKWAQRVGEGLEGKACEEGYRHLPVSPMLVGGDTEDGH